MKLIFHFNFYDEEKSFTRLVKMFQYFGNTTSNIGYTHAFWVRSWGTSFIIMSFIIIFNSFNFVWVGLPGIGSRKFWKKLINRTECNFLFECNFQPEKFFKTFWRLQSLSLKNFMWTVLIFFKHVLENCFFFQIF